MDKAQKSKSFILYGDNQAQFELLSDADAGILIKAVFEYVNTGTVRDLPPVLQMAFSFIRSGLDRNATKYADICERRSEYGRRGGLAKANKSQQELANAAYSDNDNKTESENESKNESESESDINNSPKAPSKGAKKDWPGFDSFYAAYPRHTGKAAALKAWNKLEPDQALQHQMLEALKKQKRLPQWADDNGRFIPHPATWLNGHRWEDEMEVKKIEDESIGQYAHLGITV